MSSPPVLLAHLSDLHFGGYADLAQIEALETFLPTLGADACAIAGDLSQRARHGEFQAAHAFINRLRAHLPVLEIPGAIIAGALSSYGVAFGSLTWNIRDIAVKGHLPRSETKRVTRIFSRAAPDVARVLVVHHNVLVGGLSRRMGLARWRSAQRRLLATGADVVLCGHDHQEAAGQIDGSLAVSTSGTHSSRVRGGRPSVFNLVKIEERAVHIQHFRWEVSTRRFLRSDTFSFARTARPQVAVSVAGGDQGP